MLVRFRSYRERLWHAWISIQVEYQGRYSMERLKQLGEYTEGLRASRMLLVCVLTPLPCLALSLLKELPPLAPAEAGVYNNQVFFARSWGILCFMGVSALVQMGHGAPTLKLTNRQIAWVSLLAATVSIIFIFGLSALTVFPLPFGLLIAGPPFVLVIATCFTYISGPQWRANPSILVDVKRQLVVYNCQTTLPFVYPLYIFGFVSLTGWNQVVFVTVLPVIQIIAKNWISRALAEDYDQKPQCVIFIVEVYNALYVSNVLQTASSWTATAAIMIVDLLQFWVSMSDVVKLIDEVNVMMSKIPRHHPCVKENFVQVAVRLMKYETKETKHDFTKESNVTLPYRHLVSKGTIGENRKGPEVSDTWIRKWIIPQEARVFPSRSPLRCGGYQSTSTRGQKPSAIVPEQHPQAKCIGLDAIFSKEERDLFIEKATHVLFITEYLVLVEYVEVVLPFVYCLHQSVLFHMHNSAHYPTLAGVSSDEFSSRMLSTLLYSLLEFGSFVMLVVVLKRKVGYSSLQQLSFVLDVQARVVQTKLNLIFIYIMQVSLAHHGADFSFKFAWLHSDRTS